jgi:translation elongation factor EF-Tu-like GTPase
MGLTLTRLLNGPTTTHVPGVRDYAKNVVIAGNGALGDYGVLRVIPEEGVRFDTRELAFVAQNHPPTKTRTIRGSSR